MPTSVSKSSLRLLLGRFCISTERSSILPWPGWGISHFQVWKGSTGNTSPITRFMHRMPVLHRTLLSPVLSSPTAVDLLDKMLQLDVEKRLTATEALAHPYFDQFRDIEEETEAQQSYDDSLEHEKLSIDEWRSKKFYLLWSFCLARDFPASLCSLCTCWVRL